MALDRDSLIESVSPIADALAHLASQLLANSSSPPAGSWLDQQLRSDLNLPSDGGFPIVREALVAAMCATLSGVDHVNAWCGLIRGETATISLATTTRGALEGFAKASALLRASDTRTLISRHIAITEADLRFPLRYSQFEDYTGRVLDNARLRDAHIDIVTKLGLGRPNAPSAQTIVQDLLRAATHDESGVTPEIYSQLSGPAHGAMSALGMYIAPAGGGYVLPEQIAEEQTAYLFAGTCVVADAWLNKFGAAKITRKYWRNVRQEAEVALIRSNPTLRRGYPTSRG